MPNNRLYKMQLLSKVKSLFAKRDKRQEKELQEDFLKAIYEQGGSMSTDEAKRSAEALHTNNEGISAIVGALALQGEITIGDQLKLTEKGRTHALKLIRAHRIYEQYLAEHSGYAPPEWHERAHRMEHRISDAEQERIASLLGNPLFDPHGDPIPTHSLEIVSKEKHRQPITTMSWWRITHVEDDDKRLFIEIADKGLTKDSVIFITYVDNLSIKFRYEGEHFTLPIAALEAINMEPVDDKDPAIEAGRDVYRLIHLEPGKTVQIVGLSPSCRGALRRRLLDLGFVKGSNVSIDMPSPMGNPIAYIVRGTAIALRHDQAAYILVKDTL